MPCYSVDTSEIVFSENTDPKLLAEAMRSLGYTVMQVGKGLSFAHVKHGRGTFENGVMTVRSTVDQAEIKRAYSSQVVQYAAKKFGWQVKQESPTKFQVTRRA